MLDWILNPRNAAWIGWALALGTPLAAAGFLSFAPSRNRRRFQSGFFWLAAGSGPLLVVLWFLSAGIIEIFGLDSFPGLFIHLLLFAGTGLLVGALLRWSLRRNSAKSPNRKTQPYPPVEEKAENTRKISPTRAPGMRAKTRGIGREKT